MIWRRCSLSAENVDALFPRLAPLLLSLLFSQLSAQLLQRAFVAYHQERLGRRFEQVEEVPCRRPRVNLAPIREQLHRPPAAGGVEQPLTELVSQRPKDRVQLGDRKAPVTEVRQDQELEELDRRVTPLRESARGGTVRPNRGRQQPARIPHLKLARRQ